MGRQTESLLPYYTPYSTLLLSVLNISSCALSYKLISVGSCSRYNFHEIRGQRCVDHFKVLMTTIRERGALFNDRVLLRYDTLLVFVVVGWSWYVCAVFV